MQYILFNIILLEKEAFIQVFGVPNEFNKIAVKSLRGKTTNTESVLVAKNHQTYRCLRSQGFNS